MRAIARACTPEALVPLALACALALSGLGLGASAVPRAWADEAEEAQQAVDDAQATLDDAEQRMESISDDYDAIKQEVDELQARVDEIAAQALNAQQAVVEGRTALGKAAVYEYRDGGSAQSLLTLVLEARDFNELTRNLSYLGAVMQYHADEVEAQKERSATYEKLIDDLNFQKNEQEKKLQELEAKRAEAESVVSEANYKLENAQSDQASRLEALRKMAEELAAAEGATEPVIDESANTMGREDVVDPGTQVEPNPEPRSSRTRPFAV
uniref:coiled-coil domain-containing protein n=1 Tax=Eggerthella sinensis TaxID=242230 RepID=UPI0022E79FE4